MDIEANTGFEVHIIGVMKENFYRVYYARKSLHIKTSYCVGVGRRSVH